MTLDHLTPAVRWVFGAVVVALIAVTAVVEIIARRQPDRDHAELRLRVRTWWIIVVLFGLALLLNRGGAIVFFACVSALALREYLALIPPRVTEWQLLFWAYACVPLQYLWVYIGWYGVFIIFIPVYSFLFLPARLVLMGKTEGFVQSTSDIHWGLMTTVFCISHAAYLYVMVPSADGRWQPQWPAGTDASNAGAGLLLLLILLTEANDIFQYLWGKTFGHIRIAPHVSPRKTVAGFIGGVATTTALATLIGPWLTYLDTAHAAIAGLIVGLAGFIGDLAMSAVKRDLGVKDTGTALPGHGGILDRIDSLTYTAPLMFHFVWFCYG